VQNKERILKAVRQKQQVTYKGKSIRMTADFSSGILNARRASNNELQVLKEYFTQQSYHS
jgi:hypothetical protein